MEEMTGTATGHEAHTKHSPNFTQNLECFN